MKKILLSVLTIAFVVIIWSCADSLEDEMSCDDFEQLVIENEPHFVTLQDVQNLTNALSSSTRSNCVTQDIICYEDDEHDTLLYIFNKENGGWTIYASDTRVPAIVAQSETGSFSHASENEALMTWVATIAEDMKIVKHASDAELNFTLSEIESNRKFWKSISFPDKFAKEIVMENETRKELPPPTPDFSDYGHYELLSVEQYVETLKYVPRLTHTNWSQIQFSNIYCPFKSDNSGEHAPAGCVAIAGAQMLYFLHDTLGVPLTAPSQAYCYSDITAYPDYVWGQSSPSSSIWDSMTSSGENSGPLVANVGSLVGMEYGNDGSSANASYLVYGVFEVYGIECVDVLYNTTYLTSSLLDSIPVIIYADMQGTDEAHTFIADKYISKRDVIKTTYMWVYDSIPLGPDGHQIQVPILPNQVNYTYSSYAMIGMNWGWGIEYNSDNEWFNLTGNWFKNNGIYLDDNHRHMIYNFGILN